MSKFVKKYQPVDEDGNPIGAEQTFEADSEQELIDKLANANVHAIRKINRMNRQEKLLERIGSDNERPLRQPRQLTRDELFELSNQLSDPATAAAAAAKITEAMVGAAPDDVRAELIRLRQERARAEAESFTAGHPEYVVCPENSTLMMDKMTKHRLALTRENFEIVFEELREAGLLKLKTTNSEQDEEAEPEDEESRIAPPVTTVTRKRGSVSTGLMSRHSSAATEGTRKTKEPSAEEIAAMSAEEYKQRILLPDLARRRAQR